MNCCVCGDLPLQTQGNHTPRTVVIIEMWSFLLVQKENFCVQRVGWGRHILQISSSYVKSLENMILLTGIVFLGPYLKDEDLIEADNVCNVLHTSTKLETV